MSWSLQFQYAQFSFFLQLQYRIHVVNYAVVLEDSVGEIVEQVEVDSDSCEDGICSTSLSLPQVKLS